MPLSVLMPEPEFTSQTKTQLGNREIHGQVMSLVYEGLLERFRHDEQGRHLGKLAAVELPEDEDFDAAAELAECIDQLVLAGRKERIDFLIEKQKLSGLSDAEKAELRQLY